MSNEFTKDMLVAGKHVVEYRDGNRRLVVLVGNYFNLVGVNGNVWLKKHNENLIHNDHYELDIVKVYEIRDAFWFDRLLEEGNLNLVWQREEKSQQELEYEKLMEQISELQKQAEKLKP